MQPTHAPQTIRPLTRLCFLAAAALLIAGCASSPPTRYYTLSATAPGAAPTPDPSTNAPTVAVGPVSLPALVDRPQIVVSDGGNEVRLDEFNRWASPLQENVARVVADELAALLATPRVTLLAQSGAADAQYRVAIDVRRFVSQPGRSAQFEATWNVRRVRDDASRSGRSAANVAIEEAGRAGYDALAGAHSRALAQLARDIAAAIGELAR